MKHILRFLNQSYGKKRFALTGSVSLSESRT